MSSAAPSFPHFGALPPEIRCMIWRLSVPAARIIPLLFKSASMSYVSRIVSPAILRTTRESRQEGLKIYHEILLGDIPNIGCYVDLSNDIPYFDIDSEATIRTHPFANPGFTGRNFPHNDGEFGFTGGQHLGIILHGLHYSPDALVLGKIHFELYSFKHLLRALRYYQIFFTKPFKDIVLVNTCGMGPFTSDLKLEPVKNPPTYESNSQRDIPRVLRQSYIAMSAYANMKQRRRGKPAFLSTNISLMKLDKGGI